MTRTLERIGAALLIGIFAWLWSDADRQSAELAAHLNRHESFVDSLDVLIGTATRPTTNAVADSQHSAWKRDLMERPVLLPAGVLGGTMRIRAESDVRILDDRFVWARFDDGHITGSAVFERHNGPSGGNAWRMIGYVID